MDQTQFAILYDSLRSITHCLDIHSRMLHRQIGVTVSQFSILLALSHESPLSVSNLSQKIHLSSSTISVMTPRLVTKGLITKETALGDRRQVLLHLTNKGSELLKAGYSPLPPGLIANFTNGMPDWEINMILATLQKLVQMMRHQEIDPE